MKRITLVLFILLFALLLCSCVPNKSAGNDTINKEEKSSYCALTNEELEILVPEIKKAYNNIEEFAIYGKYNGYCMVEYNSHQYLVVSYEIIADISFSFPGKPQTIHGYYDGKLYELKDLYDDGKITYADLKDIYQKHCNWENYLI